MVGSPVIRPSSRERSSSLRARRRLRGFIAYADAVATAEQKVADLKAQIDTFRDLSTSLAFDEVGRISNGS